jgi:putative membrane protein
MPAPGGKRRNQFMPDAATMTDLVLAILHHLLILAIAGLLAAQLVLVRPGLSAGTLALVGRLDGAYGGLSMAVILVGVGRVVWGVKGWEYYVSNHAFWGKMAAFLVVGLLSVGPTRRFIAWRKAAAGSAGYAVAPAEVAGVRSWLKAEAAVFVLIPIFAAMMARGIGY